MPFFARPDLSDEQFKQLEGSQLTLSGQTRIASTSGLTLTDGSGGYIPIIATGATPGNVLTYCNGEITLRPGGGGGGTYSGATPTTIAVGGLPAGCPIGGMSISDILEDILVPAIGPTSSLSIASGGASRQFGDCSVGNLCWNVTKNTNLINFICASTDGSGGYNCSLYSGAGVGTTGSTVSYIYSFSCATPATSVVSTNVGYSLCAKSTAAEVSTSPASITWQNKKFSFANGTLYSSGSITTVLSATTGQLSTTKALTCTMTLNNQFFYYAYPANFPGASAPSFTVNGLPNNAWGNLGTGTLFPITFVNTNGYSSPYYVARSDNKITGTYNIIVS